VRRALDGIQSAYFVYPILPGLLDATAYFAQSAKEAGVPAVVNMSQVSARREAKSHAARDHWPSERIFDWSGLGVTHLRPTIFSEWLLRPYVRPMIRDEGVIKLPFGQRRHAPIAAEDQSRLIASILLNPEPHVGKSTSSMDPSKWTTPELPRRWAKYLIGHHASADRTGGVSRAAANECSVAVFNSTSLHCCARLPERSLCWYRRGHRACHGSSSDDGP
jgi:uncharacterized protein YbjT (DUF2867 family)